MKKKVLIAGAVVAAAFVVVLGCGLFRHTEEAEAAALPNVETVQPHIGSIYLTTDLTGTVEPEEVIYIYPEVTGTVTDVSIKAGDIVARGQLLCVIDTKQVESYRNTLETAELALKEAQTELTRQQVLYSSGGISQQVYESYVNTAERARLSCEQARRNYENQVSYSQITAPINGVVESCDAEVFDKVSPSAPLCVISGEGDKVISTGLTEQMKDAVRIGDEIKAEKNGRIYRGLIYEISTMADSSNGLYKTKCRIEGENPLSTGSVVKMSFVSERAEQVMTVPVDAVYYENGNPYVYTYDNGTVHKIFIETGIYDSEQMEIRSGLENGSQVIVTWSPELYEGALVERKQAGGEEEE
ncbi:efflux RND transporter periplasmic adaptor subunit [Clostridium transplantifaecale]|uniref:efflux RND transporter periplasmic adaptor subunit n=1 Tax=Clostridium transplantifaecale TaxID=2479838 RepID=UPI000F63690D|nr:efflux RND transporter periplasmic adaptor subunit [Clostridium transplantifaecale]